MANKQNTQNMQNEPADDGEPLGSIFVIENRTSGAVLFGLATEVDRERVASRVTDGRLISEQVEAYQSPGVVVGGDLYLPATLRGGEVGRLEVREAVWAVLKRNPAVAGMLASSQITVSRPV